MQQAFSAGAEAPATVKAKVTVSDALGMLLYDPSPMGTAASTAIAGRGECDADDGQLNVHYHILKFSGIGAPTLRR
jgi:hypothetical protein